MRRSVESVQAQSFEDWELIIVDDGSGDNTAAIARELAGEDSRIRAIRQRNSGPGAARNTGIDAAKSDYLAFIDADDPISPSVMRFQHNKG